MPSLLLVCGVLLGLVAPAARGQTGSEAGHAACVARTPYRVQVIAEHWRVQGQVPQYRFACEVVDLDGDGAAELLTSNGRHLIGEDCADGVLKPEFQINLEPGWGFLNDTGKNVAITSDLDGDRSRELHVVVVRDDGLAWRYRVIDVATEKVLLDVPLPVGEDRRADGIWDAQYMPLGWLDDADGRGNPALAVLCTVEYDATDRGVIALDPRDGHVVWRWTSGNNPERCSAHIADLAGDGAQEIILFGTSPDNLGGRPINGVSDDVSRLIVLSSRGELIWREDVGGALQHGEVATCDLDGDGDREIITYTSGGKVGEINKLVVWDVATRRPLVTQRQAARFLGLAIVPGPTPGSRWFFTGSDDGYFTRFLYQDGRMIQEERRLTGHAECRVVGAVDILPTPGPEIVTNQDAQELVVFDTDLQPLARWVSDSAGPMQFPVVWQRTSRDSSLIIGSSWGYAVLDFVRNPTVLPAAVPYAAAGLLVVLGLFLAYRAGRSRGRREEPAAPGAFQIADSEVLYRVWRQLDDVKHERFLEVNRGLRRLVWLLEAYATELGASDELRDRIGQLLADFVEAMRPRLMEILRLAREENFEVDLVERTAAALDSLGALLAGLDSASLDIAAVQACSEEMKKEVATVEAGLVGLWQAMHRYFSTDPVRMLQGMLLVREVEFERAGIEVRFAGADEVADPVCLVDGGGLRFVLDNLISNAVHAMDDSPVRLLDLEIAREGREVTLRVSDTGRGVPRTRREQVFNGRTSDRAGGGTGLFRSREILQKWGGEIELADRATGQGTTFVVKLRAARAGEATAAPPREKAGEA